MRNNDKADGGYFEDLPKLLFILFAVAMFIFSTVTAYTARGQFNERVAMLDELNDFSDEILTWQNITPEREGILDAASLSRITLEDFEFRFSPEVKRFEYRIQIYDRSLYVAREGETRLDYGPYPTQDVPEGVEVYTKTVPVVIKDHNDNYRAGHLIISIWR